MASGGGRFVAGTRGGTRLLVGLIVVVVFVAVIFPFVVVVFIAIIV